MIFDLAKREGVVFQYNSRVVDADSASGYVELHTGERLYADVIVGADGYDSILRPLVTEFDNFQNQEMHLFLTFVIPVELLRMDKDLTAFTDPRVVRQRALIVNNHILTPLSSGLIGLVTDTSFMQILWYVIYFFG